MENVAADQADAEAMEIKKGKNAVAVVKTKKSAVVINCQAVINYQNQLHYHGRLLQDACNKPMDQMNNKS